jgi:hypothetical protein
LEQTSIFEYAIKNIYGQHNGGKEEM